MDKTLKKISITVTVDEKIKLDAINVLNSYNIKLIRLPVSQLTLGNLNETFNKLNSLFKGFLQLDLHGNEKGRILPSSNMIDSGTKYGNYVPLKKGDHFYFTKNTISLSNFTNKYIQGTIYPDALEVGDYLYISDDEIVARLVSKTKRLIEFRVEKLRNVKGLYPTLGYTSPGISLSKRQNRLLSEKDRSVLDKIYKYGLGKNIKQLAFSFIDSKKDIEEAHKLYLNVKDFLHNEFELIFKLESYRAVENINQIIKETNAVFKDRTSKVKFEIARGDLGVTCTAMRLDLREVQKFLVEKLKANGYNFIIATHVFDSLQSTIESLASNSGDEKVKMSLNEIKYLNQDIQLGATEFMLAAEGRKASQSAEILNAVLNELISQINKAVYEDHK